MKTILVPTDFSKYSLAAVKYTIQLAEKTGSKIVFLHSTFLLIPTMNSSTAYFQLVSADKSNKVKILDKFIKNAYKALNLKKDESRIKCIIKFGPSLVQDILEVMHEQFIDMIIMGTQGASGLKKVIFGSNTVKTIEQVQCPVLVVPEKTSFDGIRKIAYATNYHSSDIANLKQLVDIAKVFKAKINVIHIADGEYTHANEEEYIRRFGKKVKQKINYTFISYQLLYGDDTEKVLEQYLKKEPISFLAMSTKHRDLIGRLFGRSITKKLAYHTRIPLMAFHYKQELSVFI